MTLCAPGDAEKPAYVARKAASRQVDLGPNMFLDSELYEGIVSQPIIDPKVNYMTPPPSFSSVMFRPSSVNYFTYPQLFKSDFLFAS